MEKYLKRISRLCYFRKVTREDRISFLDRFVDEVKEEREEKKAVYFKIREEIKTTRGFDYLKIALLCVIILGIAGFIYCTAFVGLVFNGKLTTDDVLGQRESEGIVYRLVLYGSTFGIIPVFVIGLVLGKLFFGLQLREYLWHYIALGVYLLACVCFYVNTVLLIVWLFKDLPPID